MFGNVFTKLPLVIITMLILMVGTLPVARGSIALFVNECAQDITVFDNNSPFQVTKDGGPVSRPMFRLKDGSIRKTIQYRIDPDWNGTGTS